MSSTLSSQAAKRVRDSRRFQREQADWLRGILARIAAGGIDAIDPPDDDTPPPPPPRKPSPVGTPEQAADIRRLLKEKGQPQKVLAAEVGVVLRTLAKWLHDRIHLDELMEAAQRLPDTRPPADPKARLLESIHQSGMTRAQFAKRIGITNAGLGYRLKRGQKIKHMQRQLEKMRK